MVSIHIFLSAIFFCSSFGELFFTITVLATICGLDIKSQVALLGWNGSYPVVYEKLLLLSACEDLMGV